METLKKFIPYVIILIVVILIRSFIITPAIVNGDSMKDTLLDNEVVLVNKISLKTSGIKRFDIVVIKSSEGTIVKRVIAFPGEKVEYKKNVLYINDKKIKTQKFKNTEDFKYKKVEKNHYYVLGDNREVSLDSRAIGTISEKEIIGKVKVIIFPFKRVGRVY